MIGIAPREAGAAPDGQLRIGAHVSLAPTWFDPAETSGIITPFMLLYAMHDAMDEGDAGQSDGALPRRSLDHGARWAELRLHAAQGRAVPNGEPLTAEDVKFSLERYRGAASKTLKERVAGVDIHDPHRLTIRLNEPWPDFLTFYASATGAGWIVPKKYVDAGRRGRLQESAGRSGTLQVRVVHAGRRNWCVRPSRATWRKVPAIKRLVFKVIPDEATRLAALQRGEVDIAYSIRGELADELARTPGLTIKPALGSAPFWLYFPEQWDPQSPWHDRRVRQATGLRSTSRPSTRR